MNRVVINLEALSHNLAAVGELMREHGATWTVVVKSLCGHQQTIEALQLLGIRSIADSRLGTLAVTREVAHELETWYLRPPHLSAAPEVVRLAHVSMNSELDVIRALSEAAVEQDRVHRVVIMIELGDLREGLLPQELADFYETVFELPNIEVPGLGAYVGVQNGIGPNTDQLSQLLLYRELLELKYDRPLPLISAGTTDLLPLLMDGKLPRGINHFRIGEACFLGTAPPSGEVLPGFRGDVVRVEAEIAEIKEKSLVPAGETGGITPFEHTAAEPDGDLPPGQRGYRALVTIGQLDTDIFGLTPTRTGHQIAGASSDISVVNLGEGNGYRVGETIAFEPSYEAFVRLMGSSYIEKAVRPSLDEFAKALPERWKTPVPPTVEGLPPGAAPQTASST